MNKWYYIYKQLKILYFLQTNLKYIINKYIITISFENTILKMPY